MWKQRVSVFVLTVFAAYLAISGFAPTSVSTAPSLVSVALTPTSVVGGVSSRGTVVPSGMAPLRGIVVSLTATDPSVASVPSTVRVMAFKKSANLTVSTNPGSVKRVASIFASYGGTTKVATLTVNRSPATGTSTASRTATPISAATLTVNDFANYRVFQRAIDGTSKSVTISGAYSDLTWSRVEARVLRHGTDGTGDTTVVGWTTIDSTYGGGTFSGDLTVPQGGWYNVEARALDATGSVIGSSRGTNKWGVGMIILVIGQSNMSGRGQPPFTIATSDLAVNYSNAGRWEHLADPYDDESPAGAVDQDASAGGSMIPGIANSLLQTFDFPVAFVPSAKGGSNLYVNGSNYGWAYRNPSNHFDTSTLYGQSITKAQSVGGVELIIMHQGEADLSAGRTEAQYEADFATMIGHYREDLYSNIPIVICQLGTVGAGTDAGATGIRNAQHDLDNGTSIFMGATAMDLPRFDTWHYDTSALTVIGSRVANAIKVYLGWSTYYRGPSINSVFLSDGNRNQVIVTLNHRGGADITPATGITGFEVFDNGTSVSVGSAARYAADAVRLTLSQSIAEGHTVTLRYLYGMRPNATNLVKDNSPLALPLENTTADIPGDVNVDGLVNSTDALIVLSADVGLNTSQFCPMNCGDVNADGYVDSTDALIILSYDVGMIVPFPVGQPGCPSSVTPPPGCTP
jgi:hypothetical protein